ncbi:hypothetical protein FK088_23705 [Salmonella enterica]|nr:hypothetical protein [Salmonella enterica]EBI1926876.1 hypothetical protein [Salmonella enterica]
MAVGSGWVGSQAVAETGQRWMSAAGAALRTPAPFWMSSLVGRSVVGVASYVNHTALFIPPYAHIPPFVEITLTSPVTGTVTTNNPRLVVSAMGGTPGGTVTVSGASTFGVMGSTPGFSATWSFIVNDSVLATYTSNF